MSRGYVVLKSGECFEGEFLGGIPMAGEIVFNTSHTGYEEMATDPSYFNQILVTTAAQQGNYGVSPNFWESRALWIRGFVSLDIQRNAMENSWLSQLLSHRIPVITEIDTRALTITLRDKGSVLGAVVPAENKTDAFEQAMDLIEEVEAQPKDWAQLVSRRSPEIREGDIADGPKVAVMDFGCKENIIRELVKRCSAVQIFPARAKAQDILNWNPDGILLSNGPGDPEEVRESLPVIQELIGKKFLFGICMGHQLLALAVGAKTFKLPFGHRGGNHPIKDDLLNRVYISSQNHGYAVDPESLPGHVQQTHTNLYDQTLAGMASESSSFMSVQFHPESHPGPNDAAVLFDHFIRRLR